MAKKEFMYRGKTWEEVEQMSLEELAKILPARQRRSLQHGLSEVQKTFLKRLRRKPQGLKTHLRDMDILPEMAGKKVLVHNGKEYLEVFVDKEMIGHYLGEFALTRRRVQHSAPGIGATKSSGALAVR